MKTSNRPRNLNTPQPASAAAAIVMDIATTARRRTIDAALGW